MTTRISNPKTKRQSEYPIPIEKRDFSRVLYDGPRSKCPTSAVKYLKNCQIQESGELRGKMGSRRYGTVKMPVWNSFSGISASKATVSGNHVVTVTAGATVDSTWIGKYFVWQNADGEDIYHDLIIGISLASPTTKFYVLDSTARTAVTAGWLRAPMMAAPVWHPVHRVTIEVIDDDVYMVDEGHTLRTLIAYADSSYALDGTYSEIKIIEKDAIIFNRGGIFRISFDQMKVFKLNPDIMDGIVTTVDKTEDDVYGYRYWLTQVWLDESDDSLASHDRRNSKILHESAPYKGAVATTGINKGKIVDYGELWGALPVGNPSVHYGKLTGATMSSPYDTIAGWKAVKNWRFKIAMGSGTAQNIELDFTKCYTMFDMAVEIQTRMRVYWASVEVKFVTGHFEIKNPEDNAALNYATAPDGGTDASTALGLGAGLGSVSSSSGTTASAVTEPVKYSSRSVVITRTTTEPYHFNYWGLYRSKDVGVNGTDKLLGAGNQPEKGLWVADIAIATLTYTDTTSDDNLREEEAQRVLVTRTFVPLPNCNTGAVANGFLVGADSEAEEVSYCQIKYLKDYQMGYHYNGEDGQYDTISDTVKRVTSFPDCVIAYGSRSIWRASTTQGQKNNLPDFGITIGFMTQFSKIADWGVFDRYAINESTIKNKRYDIIKTSDGKIVLFDGYEFSKDFAKDMSSLMKKLQNISASSYSHMTGFRYFGTEDAVNTAGGSY